MAAQLLSEKQIQTPHLPEQIREAAYRQELPIHPCQCHQAPAAKDLAGLATKLLKVMKACAVVPKDKQNAKQGYKYASSDAILEKVNPALCEAGLATVCRLEILDRQPRTTGAGAIWELVTVRARITIIDTATGASANLEVTLKCPGSLTAAQQCACSASAANNTPVTCESGGCTVSGIVEKMCCSSCGSSVSLGQCSSG